MVGIIHPRLGDVLKGTPWLDELWGVAAKGPNASATFWSVVKRLRQGRFDLAVLLTNSLRTAMLAALGGVRKRVGYARDGRSWLLTHPIQVPRIGRRFQPVPMVDYYLQLAEAVGCPTESPRLELGTIAEDEESADFVWDRLGLCGDRGVVILNSSGAFGGSKLWPLEYFAQLAQHIVDRLEQDVLVFCGPQEQEAARQIVRLAQRDRVVSMAGQPMDFGTAKAVLRRGRLMISTDSGPRHIAAAFGVPVITLYGPLLPIWSQNPTQQAIDLWVDLPCLGCGKRRCPYDHHACMRQLSVDRVYEAVVELFGAQERHAA